MNISPVFLLPKRFRLVRSERHAQARIDYDAKIMVISWTQFVKGTAFRQTLNWAAEQVANLELRYWVADLAQMNVISPVDQQWTAEVFFPKIQGSSLEKMAIVRSQDELNQLSVQTIMERSKPLFSFEVAYFATLKEALAWVDGQ